MKWNKANTPDNNEAKPENLSFDPCSVIARLVLEKLKQEDKYAEEQKIQNAEFAQKRIEVYEDFLQYCRPATAIDYAKWVKGYMLNDPDSDRLRYANHNLEDPGVMLNITISDKGITESPGTDENAIDAMPLYKMWVLEDLGHTKIPEAYGALSFNVIIPKGSTISAEEVEDRSKITYDFSDGIGHNKFYFMDDFSTNSHWVDLHADVADVFDRKLV